MKASLAILCIIVVLVAAANCVRGSAFCQFENKPCYYVQCCPGLTCSKQEGVCKRGSPVQTATNNYNNKYNKPTLTPAYSDSYEDPYPGNYYRPYSRNYNRQYSRNYNNRPYTSDYYWKRPARNNWSSYRGNYYRY